MSPRRASHPFWRFSLGLYRRSGVEQACLGLQNACGADVNLLLFCCWLGSQGRALDRRSLRRAIAAAKPWQEQVVEPLRRARRALKRPGAAVPEAWRAHLRQSVFRLELDAEYVEQLLLARLAARLPRPARRQEPQAAAAASLERYLGLLGAPLGRATKRRMMALCRA
jgi:uncharacterized protein (TIGR02444 family)